MEEAVLGRKFILEVMESRYTTKFAAEFLGRREAQNKKEVGWPKIHTTVKLGDRAEVAGT
jgi:hypothetical protein